MVIRQHVTWAKEARVDFFVINWIGARTWDDENLSGHCLPVLHEQSSILPYV